MNWYYIDGPKRVGPFTETEWDALVQHGAIGPETRVWNEELPSWMPWKDVPQPDGGPLGHPDGSEADADADAADTGATETDEGDIFTRHARRRLGLGLEGAESAETAGTTEEAGTLSSGEPGELLLDAPAGPAPEVLAELERRALEPDYQIRFGAIFRRSVALLKTNLPQLAGATLLIYGVIYIVGAMPLAGLFMNFLFSGVLLGGLFSLFIKRLRGYPVEMGEILSGFRHGYLRHLARKTLLSTAILTAFFLPGLVAVKLAGIDLRTTENEELLTAILALDPFGILLCILLFGGGTLFAIYFNICWLFAIPLIRDKGIPYRQAMRLSRLRVLQHPWRITAVLVGSGLCFLAPGLLLSILGALAGSSVGGLVSVVSYTLLLLCLPALTAVLLVMYEEAFGALIVPKAGEPRRDKTEGA